MAQRRRVEVFSSGCAVCEDVLALVRRLGCDSCEIIVLDMHDAEVANRARQLGIRSVPAVAVDGRLAECCAVRGPDEATLRAAGVGQSLG